MYINDVHVVYLLHITPMLVGDFGGQILLSIFFFACAPDFDKKAPL